MSGWRWCRCLMGGHWERWWIGSPVNAWAWLQHWSHGYHPHYKTERPPLGEVLTHCESHGDRW